MGKSGKLGKHVKIDIDYRLDMVYVRGNTAQLYVL